MAAVAVVKNPAWAATQEIPAPLLVDNKWVSRPTNQRKIIVWENFKRDEILADFYQTMDKYVLVITSLEQLSGGVVKFIIIPKLLL
jgi:hypothetical protein